MVSTPYPHMETQIHQNDNNIPPVLCWVHESQASRACVFRSYRTRRSMHRFGKLRIFAF
ncbi:hypothetical protein LINGRAHAP2_LOCUS11725 [Linum grandiflorum]